MNLKAHVYENDFTNTVAITGTSTTLPAVSSKKYFISTIIVTTTADSSFQIKNDDDNSLIFYTKTKALTPLWIDLKKEVWSKDNVDITMSVASAGSFQVVSVLK